MDEDLLKTPLPMVRQARLPSVLEVNVPLSIILTDLAVNFSVGGVLLVRVFFDKGSLKLVAAVYRR
jgi:hypothetical protein